MTALLIGLLIVIAALVVAFGAYTGIGLLAWRAFRQRELTLDVTLSAFWLGFALVTAAIQLVHFVRPLDGWITVIILALGAIGLALNAPALGKALRCGCSLNMALTAATLVLIVWMGNRAMGPPMAWDTGFYHLAGVQWANAYPVIAGHANLQPEFGLSTASFLHAALWDVGPLDQRAQHLLHPLLLLVLGVEVLAALGRLLRSPAEATLPDIFRAVLIIPVVHLATEGGSLNVASLSPDFAASVVSLAAITRLVGLFANGMADPSRRVLDAVTVAGLVAVAPAIKVSTMAFGAVAGLILAGWYLLRWKDWKSAALPGLICLAVLPGAILATWLVRNIILSGYPLYPLPIAALPVEWRLPEPIREEFSLFVLLGNRGVWDPDAPWMKHWFIYLFKAYRFDAALPAALAVAAAGAAGVAVLIGKRLNRAALGPALVLIPFAIATLVWILLAPSPRFTTFLFWSMAALFGGWAVLLWTQVFGPRLVTLCVAGLILAGPALLALRYVSQRGRAPEVAHRAFYIEPGPDHGLHEPPVAELTTYKTESGLVIHKPTGDHRTWLAPLIRSPFRLPTLRLADPDNIAAGFVIDEPVPTGIYSFSGSRAD